MDCAKFVGRAGQGYEHRAREEEDEGDRSGKISLNLLF